MPAKELDTFEIISIGAHLQWQFRGSRISVPSCQGYHSAAQERDKSLTSQTSAAAKQVCFPKWALYIEKRPNQESECGKVCSDKCILMSSADLFKIRDLTSSKNLTYLWVILL